MKGRVGGRVGGRGRSERARWELGEGKGKESDGEKGACELVVFSVRE